MLNQSIELKISHEKKSTPYATKKMEWYLLIPPGNKGGIAFNTDAQKSGGVAKHGPEKLTFYGFGTFYNIAHQL